MATAAAILAAIAAGLAPLVAAAPAWLVAIWTFATSRVGSLLLVGVVAFVVGEVRADRRADRQCGAAALAAQLATTQTDLALAQLQAGEDQKFLAAEQARRAAAEKRLADVQNRPQAERCIADADLVRRLRGRD